MEELCRVPDALKTLDRDCEGKTVCAVVYDSDISRNTDPPFGSLKGATLGLTAFRVTAVNPHPARGSYLPLITVDLLPSADVQGACGNTRPSP